MKTYHEILGDGGSNVAAQVASRKARMTERLAEVRSIVAIGSGKGGVGKSTMTMWLARALATQGRRVVILDADVNGPVQARLGGLRQAPLVPGPDGLAIPATAAGIGVVSFGALFPEPQSVEFDNIASGDSHTWRATREFTALGDLMLAVAWGRLDFLLVDLPPGAERTVQFAEFLGSRADFVLVTLPSRLARGVVTRSVTAIRKKTNRLLGYIENMSGYYCGDCGSVKPLFPSDRDTDLGVTCLGRVPFDPRLAAICDGGETSPEDATTACDEQVRRIAERLLEAVKETR